MLGLIQIFIAVILVAFMASMLFFDTLVSVFVAYGVAALVLGSILYVTRFRVSDVDC